MHRSRAVAVLVFAAWRGCRRWRMTLRVSAQRWCVRDSAVTGRVRFTAPKSIRGNVDWRNPLHAVQTRCDESHPTRLPSCGVILAKRESRG